MENADFKGFFPLLYAVRSCRVAFIYEEDLLIGDEICQSQTKDHKGCPYGEKHTKEECLKCMDEFLDMEVQ